MSAAHRASLGGDVRSGAARVAAGPLCRVPRRDDVGQGRPTLTPDTAGGQRLAVQLRGAVPLRLLGGLRHARLDRGEDPAEGLLGHGQVGLTGVFLPGSGGHGLWANANWGSFVAKWQEWSGQGLRLADLNSHRVGNETRYTAAFLPGNDGHALWANVTWQSFAAKWQELAGQGLRLVDFEIVNPAAGSVFDGADAGASDLSVAEEPFGGILAAVEPTAAEAAEPEGYGAAQLDGEAVAARSGGGDGGASLPSIVAPRDTAEGTSGYADGATTDVSAQGGAVRG